MSKITVYSFKYNDGIIIRKEYNAIKEESNEGIFYKLPDGIYPREVTDFFINGKTKVTAEDMDKIILTNGFEKETRFSMLSENDSVEEYREKIRKKFIEYATADEFLKNPNFDFGNEFARKFMLYDDKEEYEKLYLEYIKDKI